MENQSEPGDEDEEILNPDDLEETEDLDQLEGTRQREDRRRLEDDIRRERGRPLQEEQGHYFTNIFNVATGVEAWIPVQLVVLGVATLLYNFLL